MEGKFKIERRRLTTISPQYVYDVDMTDDTEEGIITCWGADWGKSKEYSEIVVEALNIKNETGLTPSMLHAELEKAKELIQMAHDYVAIPNHDFNKKHGDKKMPEIITLLISFLNEGKK